MQQVELIRRPRRLSARVPSQLLLPALLLSVGLAPGCGGSGDDPTPDAGTLDMGHAVPDHGMSGCPLGTQDADGDTVCEPDCANTACDHGVCTESTTTGLAECACAAGFMGAACDTLAVPSPAGVAFWIDADDASAFAFHSGTSVSAWSDRGADTLVGTSVDTGTAPTRVANVLEGRPVVRFDGTDDQLTFPGFEAFSQASGEYTMFVVLKASTTMTGSVFSAQGPGDEAALRSYDSGGDGTATLEYLHGPDLGSDVGVETSAMPYGGRGWSADAFHLVTLQRTSNSLAVWVDGNNLIGQYDAFAMLLDQDLVETLAFVLSPDGDPLEMDLAEMIVVADGLHFGQRSPYEDYLAAKWFGEAFDRDPTAFGEAAVWLDAQDADGITTAGQGVTAWANRGKDNGFFANGSFADSRPALVASALNGHPVVRFDGGDALIQNGVGSDDGVIRGEYAIVLVLDPPSTGSRQTVFQGVRASNSGLLFQLELLPGVPGLEYLHRVPAGDTGGELWAPVATFDGPRIIVIERATSGLFSIQVDDAATTFQGDPMADFLSGTVNWALGGITPSAPGAGLEGDVAEFIVMDNLLGNAEQTALVRLLRSKWGL